MADDVYSRVMELYEKSGLTAAALAEKSGVPLTSVVRYLSGDTKNPGFTNLCQVIAALGGSADEVAGIRPAPNHPSNNSQYTALLRESLADARKSLRAWQIIFLVTVALFIGFLIFDLLHPEIGFIQYAKSVGYTFSEEPAAYRLEGLCTNAVMGFMPRAL